MFYMSQNKNQGIYTKIETQFSLNGLNETFENIKHVCWKVSEISMFMKVLVKNVCFFSFGRICIVVLEPIL